MRVLTLIFVCRIIIDMRTTLSLDDDAFRLVKRYAAGRSLAIGKAVSELVRRAFTVPRPTRLVNGVQVFDLPPESPRVSTKKVLDLEAHQK
jgi:hypothetical protein